MSFKTPETNRSLKEAQKMAQAQTFLCVQGQQTIWPFKNKYSLQTLNLHSLLCLPSVSQNGQPSERPDSLLSVSWHRPPIKPERRLSFRERMACHTLWRAKLARSLPGNKAGVVRHWLMTANCVLLWLRPQCLLHRAHRRDWSAVGANQDSCLRAHSHAKIRGQSRRVLEWNECVRCL